MKLGLSGKNLGENRMTLLRKFLKRYTDLPFLLEYLMTKKLALLSPMSWDDKNDSHFLSQYAKINGNLAVYALCLTESSETYHHWKVFSSGNCGVCIEFNKEKLLEYIGRFSNVRAGQVIYRQIKELRKHSPTSEQLPFLKRAPFSDEKEFRLFLSNNGKQQENIKIYVPSAAINKIIFNPWIPKSVFEETKILLHGIEGCKSIRIGRSTLINNDEWKALGCPS